MSTAQRIFRYSLGILFVFWCILTVILGYFYVLSTSSQEDEKGGTFVEGVFSQLSYLPYLKTDSQSLFYQNLLFRGCLSPFETDEEGNLARDLCKVYTQDHQNYVVRLLDHPGELPASELTWSDGHPITIEDVFFTYDEILRTNKWWIDALNAWSSITVSLEDGKVSVSFPTPSPDNDQFFTNPLLPKHRLAQASLDEYRMDFALAPLTNGCAEISPQVKDINSLVFDLARCDRTNFAYYQIKKYQSFEEMDAGLQGGKKFIVDVYESPYSLEGFVPKRVLTPYLVGVFFNTSSDKMKVRLRRSLGGLIHARFHTGASEQYLQPYQGRLFSLFYSEGETVKDLISRMSVEDDSSVSELDLKESGAKELPNAITINGVDRKFVFFMQKPTESRTLDISFNNAFDSLKIIAPNGDTFTPKNYKPESKKVSYKLTLGENLHVGSNQYTIQGTVRGKTYVIASIDVYVFEQSLAHKTWDYQWKLNVLYFSDPVSIFVAQQLRAIFKEAGILEYFLFEEVYNPEELEGKLLMKSYDLYIGTVDLWTKKSLLSLFFTDDVLLNPSAYKNPILISLVKQYALNANKTVEEQINTLLAQDMPVVLLGYKFSFLQLQSKIVDEVFSGVDFLQENQWRNQIYTNYSLLHARRIDTEKAFNFANFRDFLLRNLVEGDSSFISSLFQ